MPPPLRLLAIAGSLRHQSSNRRLLDAAAALSPSTMQVQLFAQLADIPAFNPDHESDTPPAVAALRTAIRNADALLISSPEYAHGIPGALKNALDWLVGGMELNAKPIALFNASARSTYAQAALTEVLATLGARLIHQASVTVPLIADARSAAQLAADPAIAAPLTTALHQLAAALTGAGTSAQPPIGPPVPGWQSRPHPQRVTLAGRYCMLQPLDAAAHAAPLYAALCSDPDTTRWTYLLTSHPGSEAAWRSLLEQQASTRDPLFFTLFDETQSPAGLAAYLRIVPEHGVMEVGHIHLSPRLQQSRAATEVQYLLMSHAFDDLGYRRYEWKCDALNAPSRRAALRLGFQYEGIFRNAIVYKGRSRDTAWFSITCEEWPAVRAAFEAWLASQNFDAEGHQHRTLASLRTGD